MRSRLIATVALLTVGVVVPAWAECTKRIYDARDAIKRGLLVKDGGREALDHYFHQIPDPQAGERPNAGRGRSRRRTP